MSSHNSSSSKKTLPPFLQRAIAIRSTDRSSLQKLLLHTLNSRSDRSGTCYPTIDLLELDTGLARSTVIKIMNQLRSHGLVIRTRSGDHNHRNVYKLDLFKLQSTVSIGLPAEVLTDRPGEDINKSVRRTCTSPSQVSTSPADGLVPSGIQTGLSIKSSLKRVIEEELLTHPDSKRIELLNQWFIVLDNIDLPHQTIETWFSRFKPVDLTQGWLTIETDSDYALRWVRVHYLDQLGAMKTVTKLSEEALHAQPV